MAENDNAPSVTDATDSIAFSLINNAESMKEITEAEAEFLRGKYKKLYDTAEAAKKEQASLARRLKIVQNDILSEQIATEKSRIEEMDETSKLARASEIRNVLQRDFEATEQKDTMAKFELYELKRVHEELRTSLDQMQKKNSSTVEPVLAELRQQITELNAQNDQIEESYAREQEQEKILAERVAELERTRKNKQQVADEKAAALGIAEKEPGRMSRQINSIESAKQGMAAEHRHLQKNLAQFDESLEKQAKKKGESEKLRKNILEKLELNRQTLEEREADVATVHSNLEKAKAESHDFVTRKVELNLKKREKENHNRFLRDQLSMAEKDYENLKRSLKKKRVVANSAKQLLPSLEGQLVDQELLLRNMQDEKQFKVKEMKRMKDEVDSHVARLLQQEGVEGSRKKELEQSIQEVEELEASVVHWLAEGKRQGKLLSVLSAQRDIKARENARVEEKEKEGKQHVRIKEIMILDATKRCNEISNRLKEFSALYEVVKNERNKYVNLIQSSAQALAEMREKIRILHNEVEILGNERTAKDMALTKERNSHAQAQNHRDSLRQDLNRLLSEYRSKQSTVEQQIQEIDKLNIIVSSLEKDMILLKSKYEHSVEERNITGVQLIDRNDELCILYERSNQQQDALRKGELESYKKEENLRLIRLQTEELKRQYLAARKRIPQMEVNKKRIAELEEEYIKERKLTDELSSKLEDPQNVGRWRPLEGADPDMEQLNAKVKVLEDRLDKKREQMLEKELVLEEVTTLTEKLRSQALSKRDSAKLLADELNGIQTKIREITKKMLASVSELSMYQATALRLQQEKMQRERALDEAKFRVTHGDAPSEEAVRDFNRTERKRVMMLEQAMRREEEMQMVQPANANMLKTAAEPRPTAYIPDELGIPKPYGNLAPFKPSELGSTMKQHIKMPAPKTIEI